MSYTVTLTEVDTYLSTSLEGVQWAGKTQQEREKALVSARRTLSPYIESMTRENYLNAVSEQAVWMLCSPYAEQQLSGLSGISLTGLAYNFDTKTRPVHIAPKAWQILKAQQGSSRGKPCRTGRIR